MDKFLMICYVAADFVGKDGVHFQVGPDQIGVFIEAPGWVQRTLLFALLVKDGSVKVSDSKYQQKKLENDPMKGIGADGKATDEKVEVKDTRLIKEKEPVKRTTAKKTPKKGDAE